MKNTTRSKIFYSAFRLFLEGGYEATNIRDICKNAGIKAATLYFYFKSKEELFFHIYDEIFLDYINYIKGIEILNNQISVEDKLFQILRKKIEYYATDISKRKFIFRYHLFPSEEIASIIREKYKFYTNEENKVLLDILDNYNNDNISYYLIEQRRLEDYLIYEMAISGIKINDESFEELWNIFWSKIVK